MCARLASISISISISILALSFTLGACSPSRSDDPIGPGTASGDGGAPTLPDGAPHPSVGSALPPSTFLFLRRVAPDRDHLVARDLATGAERVVTDLTGDGSEGWTIDGFSLSPDRKTIVIASLYGPTEADVATRLSTQRIWTLDVEGRSFRRLTPVFTNTSPGTSGFRIDVREPTFSADGKNVYFTYGEQVVGKTGLTRVWSVPTEGGALPSLLDTPASCTIASPASVDPVDGHVMISQESCRDKGDEGFVFFGGNGRPATVVLPFANEIEGSQGVARWASDGSLFLFAGGRFSSASLFAYAPREKKLVTVVEAKATTAIRSGTVSPDGNTIVYCVRSNGGGDDLRTIDLSRNPPTDTALTTDGASCTPVF